MVISVMVSSVSSVLFYCMYILIVDITVCHNGFHGDLNETFFVGSVNDASKRLVQTAYECMMKGIDIGEFIYKWAWQASCDLTVRPGEKYRNIGAEVQKHAHINGFSVVRTYCGHGINQIFHALPNVPHYSSKWIIYY